MWERPNSPSLSVPSSFLQVPSLLSFAFPRHISPCFAVKCSNACSCCMWRNVDWLTIRRIPANFASSWCSLPCFALIFRSSSSLCLFPPIAGITSSGLWIMMITYQVLVVHAAEIAQPLLLVVLFCVARRQIPLLLPLKYIKYVNSIKSSLSINSPVTSFWFWDGLGCCT